MKCAQNTSVITDNTPIPCDGEYISTQCIAHPASIAFLSIPANSTQYDINNAFNNTFINQNSRINLLENGGFTTTALEIDGTYNLQVTDNKKNIIVSSVENSPRIALSSALPDGFECYIVNNTEVPGTILPTTLLMIDTEFTTPPLFTVPYVFDEPKNVVSNYGVIHIKKQSANLYTVSGDLYPYGS